MFGRFFALELGCPDEDTYLNEGEVHQGYVALPGNSAEVYELSPSGVPVPEPPDGPTMICECRGLGCKKCKRKKAKTVTLTGGRAPVPVMNVARMPMAPWTPQMIMMGRSSIF
jgi:hypothetical protein